MNKTKIFMFGDSVLKGIVYEGMPGSYHLCKDKLAVPGVDVKNCCRMGATIKSGIKSIERFLPSCDAGTVAVLEYGGNDCNYDWKAISENPQGSFSCAVPPEEYQTLMKKAIAMLKETGAQVMVSTLAPIRSDYFMNYISQGLSRDRILAWLGQEERLGRWQGYYSELAQAVAEETDCDLLPLRKAARAVSWQDWMCADGIHPNEEGHRYLNAFAAGQLSMLCRG